MSDNRFVKGAAPIADVNVLQSIKKVEFEHLFVDNNPDIVPRDGVEQFVVAMDSWIRQSKLNSIEGLDRFPHRYVIHGITQSLDDFMITHQSRRICTMPGEYPYLPNCFHHHHELTQLSELSSGDALLLSTPFASTGAIHPQFDALMALATELEVPVMIDCAYFGICHNLQLKLDHPCIERVCFSTSKAFAAGHLRAGIEYSFRNDTTIAKQNKWQYVNLLNAMINTRLLAQHSADDTFNTYRPAQLAVCEAYQLTPSDTVIFGLSDEDKYARFDRGDGHYRCGISLHIRDIHDSGVFQ